MPTYLAASKRVLFSCDNTYKLTDNNILQAVLKNKFGLTVVEEVLLKENVKKNYNYLTRTNFAIL